MTTKRTRTKQAKAEPAKVEQVAPAPVSTPEKDGSHPITINGVEYRLDFTISHLAKAEKAFNAEGRDVNLLRALSITRANLADIQAIFAAATRLHHPELGFDGAASLINMGNLFQIATAIFDALTADVLKSTSEAGKAA